MAGDSLLKVEKLTTRIGKTDVVDGVSFDMAAGEIMALVGESGSGKSLTALSVMQLLPVAAQTRTGAIVMDGRDLLTLSERQMRALRGSTLSMIFQEPVASLNPLMRVGAQVAESLVVHGKASRGEAAQKAVEMLRRVGIPDAGTRAGQYPSELSGGMCQRVMIASALIAEPALLIADEPTTALDVTIQAQILKTMKTLRSEIGTAILLITHDMGVVADIADRMCVMYGGRIMESGRVETVFENPSHPYTKLLLATVPKLSDERKTALRSIEGNVPDVSELPEGCRFRTRCPLATVDCAKVPPLDPVEGDETHLAACWHQDKVRELV